MSTSTETREGGGGLVALCGLVFVILTVVGIVVVGGDTPDNDTSAAKIASFYHAHQDRQMIAAFLVAAATPLLAIFAVGLALALWPLQSGHRRIWPILLIGGAIVSVGGFIVAAFIHFTLADAGDTLTPDSLNALNVLDVDSWMLFNSSLGVMMLGAGASLLVASKGYRIMGWIGLLLGIGLFVPFADFPALLLTGIWLIVASIMFYRRAPGAAGAAQPA
jgi:hypothetical protein